MTRDGRPRNESQWASCAPAHTTHRADPSRARSVGEKLRFSFRIPRAEGGEHACALGSACARAFCLRNEKRSFSPSARGARGISAVSGVWRARMMGICDRAAAVHTGHRDATRSAQRVRAESVSDLSRRSLNSRLRVPGRSLGQRVRDVSGLYPTIYQGCTPRECKDLVDIAHVVI